MEAAWSLALQEWSTLLLEMALCNDGCEKGSRLEHIGLIDMYLLYRPFSKYLHSLEPRTNNPVYAVWFNIAVS